MAVTLPPQLTPVEGVAAQLQQQGSEVSSFGFRNYKVHLLGQKVLSDAVAASAAVDADSLSDVVRNLASSFYAAGYPAAQLTYALSGDDLYVLPTLGHITRVDGPKQLTPYFQGLVGTAPLTDGALETRRSLASIHADRAGVDAEPVLTADGTDGYAMDLKPLPQSPDPTTLKAEFGNPGNRFVGRHFLDLSINHGFSTGDEVAATWRTALAGLNGDDQADDYHEETLSWNRVTPYGIFGLAGRNVDYSIDLTTTTTPPLGPPTTSVEGVNGDLRQAEAAWLFPIAGNFRSRWTVNAKVDYTDKKLSPQAGGAVLQDQEYGSMEAGTAYAYTLGLDSRRHLDFDAGLAIRKGLGSDETGKAVVAADLGYLLFRPQASAKLAFDDHLSVRLDLSAQITSDTVPEQSQWVMGGISNIYSYLPGVATGDSGGLAKLTAEYKDIGSAFNLRFTPRAFTEYGYAHYEHPTTGLPGGTPAIADAGLEFAAAYASWLEASIAYAKSFQDKDIDHQTLDDTRANLYFRLTIKL